MRQFKNTTSISSALFFTVVWLASLSSCKLEPTDPNDRRLTLGDIQVAVISTGGSNTDIEFHGRVAQYDLHDSLYEAPGLGTFKHFIEIQDTNTAGQTLTVYYTLPLAQHLKVDTTIRLTLIYKQIVNRSALLIKDKSDSLLCLFGTLLKYDLDQVETQGGVQNIRVTAGNEAFNTRLTDCGREGDFNMIFADNSGSISVQPAQTSVLFSGEKSYVVANIANTYLIKNTKACGDSVAQFSYAIIKQ